MANLVRCTDKYGKTPLLSACAAACYDVAHLLVQNGATVDVTTGVAYPER